MPRIVSVDAATSELLTSASAIADDGVASATLTARFKTDFGDPLPNQAVTLAIVSGTGTLTQPGGVTNQDGEVSGSVVSGTAGTLVVKATMSGVDAATTASIAVGTVPPIPGGGDTTLFDTRSGGAESFQASADFAAAETASGFNVTLKLPSNGGTTGDAAFTTNVDGANTRAFRFDLTENAGAASCLANGLSEAQFRAVRSLGTNGADGDILSVQYKVRLGKSATGGGIGTQDIYTPGGKMAILFRTGNDGGNGRITFTTGDNDSVNFFCDPLDLEAGSGVPNDPRQVGGFITASDLVAPDTYNAINWTALVATVVTITYRFKTETTAGAGDGWVECWINDTLHLRINDIKLGTLGFQEMQLGGPTYICPPQDQTNYIWDMVAWVEG